MSHKRKLRSKAKVSPARLTDREFAERMDAPTEDKSDDRFYFIRGSIRDIASKRDPLRPNRNPRSDPRSRGPGRFSVGLAVGRLRGCFVREFRDLSY
jgi:hypothetical protein